MRQVSRFYNHNDQPLRVFVEPLAERIDLAPNQECHALVFGEGPAFLEVAVHKDGVSMFAAPDCDVAVFVGGQLAAGSLDFIDPTWSRVANAEYLAWLKDLGPEQIRT